MSKPTLALGLMSGTSLDGIDLALLTTDGENSVERGPASTIPYTEAQRAKLRSALEIAKNIEHRNDRQNGLDVVEAQLTAWHADAVLQFCRDTHTQLRDINLIGFHGQTVIHRPEQKLTVQLGAGQTLANMLGVPVAYDMRAADVAAGGQGAPLVPVYHRALAAGLPQRPVAFVNIGGVANVTWIGRDGALMAFDTGPGNALIDDWMKHHTGLARDDGGARALAGHVNEEISQKFLDNGFFLKPGPKSLDRNSFAGIALDDLTLNDGAATLVAVTAKSIAMARHHMPQAPELWVICGGGRHNAAIMQALRNELQHVVSAEYCGFNGDAMEAEAWAYLAVRVQKGLALTFPGTTGVATGLTGGVIVSPSPDR